MNQNEQVVQYKQKLLQTFRAFIDICEEFNLAYFCCGGTALGAVRHQGLIPWDDDIDVFMPRRDYEALLKLQTEIEKRGYHVASMKNGDFYNLFMKFGDMNTTLWEIKEIPLIGSVYIDIFPLDSTNDNVRDFLKKYRKWRRVQLLYQLSISSYSVKDIWYYWKEKDSKKVFKGLASFLVPHAFSSVLRKKLIVIDECFKKDEGENLISPYGDYSEKEYLSKSWFDSFEYLPFEGFQVKVGKGNVDYLKQVYGDFMQLPPKEKQITHHFHYYLNLDRCMSLEDILYDINSKI